MYCTHLQELKSGKKWQSPGYWWNWFPHVSERGMCCGEEPFVCFSFFYMFINTLRETTFHFFILLISHFILLRLLTKTQYFLTTAFYQEYPSIWRWVPFIYAIKSPPKHELHSQNHVYFMMHKNYMFLKSPVIHVAVMVYVMGMFKNNEAFHFIASYPHVCLDFKDQT